MKKLIVVRHGNYKNERLTEKGRNQISALGEKLRLYVDGGSLCILSSTQGQAVESAEIIAGLFKTTFEQDPVLWSDSERYPDYLEVAEIVERKQAIVDIVLLVTHQEYADNFASFFSNKVFYTHLEPYAVEQGEAIILDCELQSAQLISYR